MHKKREGLTDVIPQRRGLYFSDTHKPDYTSSNVAP